MSGGHDARASVSFGISEEYHAGGRPERSSRPRPPVRQAGTPSAAPPPDRRSLPSRRLRRDRARQRRRARRRSAPAASRRRRADRRAPTGQERRQDAGDVLVPHRAEDERRSPCRSRSHAGRPPARGRRPGCARHRAAHPRRASVDARAAPAIGHASSPSRDRGVRDLDPERVELLEQAHRDRGVVDLMPPAEREPHARRADASRVRSRRWLAVVAARANAYPIACADRAARRARGTSRRSTGSASAAAARRRPESPGLMMPAFSAAIDASVSPSCAW